MAPQIDKLPGFEGSDPVGTALKLGGKIDRRTRPWKIGERVVLVIEGTVTGVDHKQAKGGIVRVHELALDDGYELGGDRAPDLIEQLADEYTAAMDDHLGRARLEGWAEASTVDPSAAAGETEWTKLTVAEVLEKVGDDLGRAREALAAEHEREPKARGTLVRELEALIGAAGGDDGAGAALSEEALDKLRQDHSEGFHPEPVETCPDCPVTAEILEPDDSRDDTAGERAEAQWDPDAAPGDPLA